MDWLVPVFVLEWRSESSIRLHWLLNFRGDFSGAVQKRSKRQEYQSCLHGLLFSLSFSKRKNSPLNLKIWQP